MKIEYKLTAGISNEDYHSTGRLSASGVKTLLTNPYEFLHPEEDKEENKAFLLGNLVHSMVLEPEKFDDEYAVSPQVDKRTKAGKEKFEEFTESAKGKVVVDSDTYERAKLMTQNVLHAKILIGDGEVVELGELLKGGVAEHSAFAQLDGKEVQCRPDYFREDIGVIFDLKTTQDASPDGFSKSVANFKYYVQAPFYIDVMRKLDYTINNFMFVCVEKTYPYMVGVHVLKQEDVELGRKEYQRAFRIHDNLEDYDTPIYRDMKDGSYIHTITLPNYVYYQRDISI